MSDSFLDMSNGQLCLFLLTLSSTLSQCKQLESELESSLMKSLKIKKERMAALEARLQESAKINQQLRRDLKTVSQCQVQSLPASHFANMLEWGTQLIGNVLARFFQSYEQTFFR